MKLSVIFPFLSQCLLHPPRGHLVYRKLAKVFSPESWRSSRRSLIFRSVTRVELIVTYNVRKGSISHTFILLLRRLSFVHSVVLEPLSKTNGQASLVVQWLRICLPMQGTQVQSLIQEDPTCCRTTKPVCHKY